MKQLFKIDESEKRRILEMHQTATRKNYLSEQGDTATPNQKELPVTKTTFNTITDMFGDNVPVKTSLLKIKSNDDVNKLINLLPQNQELVDAINSKAKVMGTLGKESIIQFPTATDEQTKNLTYKYLNALITNPIYYIVTSVCGQITTLPEDTDAGNCSSGINYKIFKEAIDLIIAGLNKNPKFDKTSEDTFKEAYSMLGTGVKPDSGYSKIIVQINKAPLITALSSIVNDKYQSM